MRMKEDVNPRTLLLVIIVVLHVVRARNVIIVSLVNKCLFKEGLIMASGNTISYRASSPFPYNLIIQSMITSIDECLNLMSNYFWKNSFFDCSIRFLRVSLLSSIFVSHSLYYYIVHHFIYFKKLCCRLFCLIVVDYFITISSFCGLL
jgi:hypothetical protein